MTDGSKELDTQHGSSSPASHGRRRSYRGKIIGAFDSERDVWVARVCRTNLYLWPLC